MAPSIGTPELQAQCQVPLVIGVIGHRLYAESAEEDMRSDIKRVFLRLRESHAPNTPFLIISSLAQGADQLVVEVALELRAEGAIEASFVAPLPFPLEQFARSTSFDPTPEGKAAAERMLNWSKDGTVTAYLPPLPDGKLTESDPWPVQGGSQEDEDFREKRYASCGAFLVRRCHVLIALWDEEGLTSGSKIQSDKLVANLVDYQISGRYPALVRDERSGLGNDSTGPAFIIHTPRVDLGGQHTRSIRVLVENGDATSIAHPDSRCSNFTRFTTRLTRSLGRGARPAESASDGAAIPLENDWGQFLATCHTLSSYNQDVKSMWAQVKENGIATAVRDFLYADEPEAPAQPEPWLDATANAAFRRLVSIRTAADALAQRLRTTVELGQKAMFISIGCAAFALHLYGHVSESESGEAAHNPSWLIAYLIFTALPLLLVFAVWLIRIDEKRLDYRALAEALRVRCWWAYSGISDSVADSYLSQLHSEVAWQRNSLLGISPPAKLWEKFFAELPEDSRAASLERVRRKWLLEQLRFYKGNFHKYHSRGFWARRTAVLAALTAVGISFIILCLFPSHPPEYLLMISGLSFVGGGLYLAFAERQSYEELAHQYDRMYAVFKRAEEKWQEVRPEDPKYCEHVTEILRLVGHEAILEHALWVVLRRSRAFEVPFH